MESQKQVDTLVKKPPCFTQIDADRIRSNVPGELLLLPQWVAWKWKWVDKQKKFTKPPVNPHTGRNAQSNNSKTWSSFERAVSRALDDELGGVGFMFSNTDPYFGIDLDDCIDKDGRIEPWAEEIIRSMNSYTETTPSGKGFHIIGRGKLPGKNTRKGQLEIYDKTQYFTVTGLVYE